MARYPDTETAGEAWRTGYSGRTDQGTGRPRNKAQLQPTASTPKENDRRISHNTIETQEQECKRMPRPSKTASAHAHYKNQEKGDTKNQKPKNTVIRNPNRKGYDSIDMQPPANKIRRAGHRSCTRKCEIASSPTEVTLCEGSDQRQTESVPRDRPTIRTSGERKSQSAVISRTMSKHQSSCPKKTIPHRRAQKTESETQPEGARPQKPANGRIRNQTIKKLTRQRTWLSAEKHTDGISDELAHRKL